MIEYLVLASGIFFLLFLFPWKGRKYAAILGWAAMVLFLIAEIPFYIFSENNILYPAIAILSLPFLFVTSRRLLLGDKSILALSRGAAVAFLLFAPFAYIPPLGNWLIGVVAGEVTTFVNAMAGGATLLEWNLLGRNGFKVEIILACTGIQSMAIMLGVAGAVPTTTRQKILAFLLVVPTIYILNLLRNVLVIIAYTGQWFPYFPEIASNGEYGYESFFWAHNIFAEGGALVALIAIAYGLFVLIPDLGRWAGDLYAIYSADLAGLVRRRDT
ncbi:MAG TPA: archaeosortase A [Methanomicrobiales archaeon]|jgi:archaeosortase A (PGF-CTERM-specific)|nr:archaeosortase A [Methanomicrobiales archaeon]